MQYLCRRLWPTPDCVGRKRLPNFYPPAPTSFACAAGMCGHLSYESVLFIRKCRRSNALLSLRRTMSRQRRCFNLSESRRSIREFQDKPVPRELIDSLIDIARYAPTWPQCAGSAMAGYPKQGRIKHNGGYRR